MQSVMRRNASSHLLKTHQEANRRLSYEQCARLILRLEFRSALGSARPRATLAWDRSQRAECREPSVVGVPILSRIQPPSRPTAAINTTARSISDIGVRGSTNIPKLPKGGGGAPVTAVTVDLLPPPSGYRSYRCYSGYEMGSRAFERGTF